MTRQFKIGVLILLVLSAYMLSDVTCDATEESLGLKSDILLQHKVCAIPTILIVSLVSICIPILANKVSELRPWTNGYTMIKAFTGGGILSAGLSIVLPDAFNNDIFTLELSAMIAAILILSVDAFAWSFYMSVSPLSLTIAIFNLLQDLDWCNLVTVMPLLGMIHSLIMGISTGLSTDLSAAKLLLTALIFHQYCQGIDVGEFLVIFNHVLNPWPKKVMICSALLAASVGI